MGEPALPLSPVLWYGSGEIHSSLTSYSRQETWLCPSSAATQAGCVHCLGSTVELTLYSGGDIGELTWGHEHEKAEPTTFLLCSDISKGEIPCAHSLTPTVGRRVGPNGVIKARELSLPLNCYSTWESWPCTSPEQQNGAGHGCGTVGDPAPRM